LARALRRAGVVPGDRIAGYLPNLPDTVTAMLAATSVGAIWSSCSPDFGVQGVLDRFGQIAPNILFTSSGYRHKGTLYPMLDRVRRIACAIPSLERVVVIPYPDKDQAVAQLPKAVHYDDFAAEPATGMEFTQLPA